MQVFTLRVFQIDISQNTLLADKCSGHNRDPALTPACYLTMPEPESEGGYCRSAVRCVLEVQGGVAMHATGLGPTFLEEVYLSLPRTYPINQSSQV